MRITKGILIFVAILGIVFVVLSKAVALKKNSLTETTNTNITQMMGYTTGRHDMPLIGQDDRKLNNKKYDLIVQMEATEKNSQESVSLTLTVQNHSQDLIYIVDTMPAKDFKFEIKDGSEKVVMPKENSRSGLVVNEGRQILIPINVGEEISYRIDLSNLYDFGNGQYQLIAKRLILLDDKQTKVELKSDPIQIVFRANR